jgi:hypothetical protein
VVVGVGFLLGAAGHEDQIDDHILMFAIVGRGANTVITKTSGQGSALDVHVYFN